MTKIFSFSIYSFWKESRTAGPRRPEGWRPGLAGGSPLAGPEGSWQRSRSWSPSPPCPCPPPPSRRADCRSRRWGSSTGAGPSRPRRRGCGERSRSCAPGESPGRGRPRCTRYRCWGGHNVVWSWSLSPANITFTLRDWGRTMCFTCFHAVQYMRDVKTPTNDIRFPFKMQGIILLNIFI